MKKLDKKFWRSVDKLIDDTSALISTGWCRNVFARGHGGKRPCYCLHGAIAIASGLIPWEIMNGGRAAWPKPSLKLMDLLYKIINNPKGTNISLVVFNDKNTSKKPVLQVLQQAKEYVQVRIKNG